MYSNINEQSLRGRLYKFTFCLALLFEDAPNLPFHMRTNGCQYYKKKKKEFHICVLVGEFLRNRQKADLGQSFLSHIPSDFPRSI